RLAQDVSALAPARANYSRATRCTAILYPKTKHAAKDDTCRTVAYLAEYRYLALEDYPDLPCCSNRGHSYFCFPALPGGGFEPVELLFPPAYTNRSNRQHNSMGS